MNHLAIKRGVLKSFDSGAYTATVEITGSTGGWLGGVRVSRDIASADLVTGRNVALVFFDPGNPNDGVLFAVWT